MATITITTDDVGAVQDVENFLTSLYQRGVPIEHTSDIQEVEPAHDVIGHGKGADFPSEKVMKEK